MRSDNQAKDLHYFHLYAVRDRVDLSGTSEEPPSLNPDINLSELLPTEDEHFSDVLTHHIPHIYDAKMKEVSEVVRSIICKLIINEANKL